MVKQIKFSPPDITELEINEVTQTLKSGWITTGPKTKLFETKISNYCNTKKTVCLNSWTAAMELALRIIGIGPGDEVITSAYTYTASASIIDHVGAKIILVDTKVDSWEMDYDQLAQKITSKTKAIIPVDIGGMMCDYDKILSIVKGKSNLFRPTDNLFQKSLKRIFVLADAAHSFGATYKNRKNGTIADFTAFSFHAVKNLTTAEGGAITWSKFNDIDDDYIYNQFQLYSLHGQNKDALSKSKPGSWEYDILIPGFKCNMTDIASSIGLIQLERHDSLLAKRKILFDHYYENLNRDFIDVLQHKDSAFHLLLVRIKNCTEAQRNQIITQMASRGISTNVHYKPLPMFTAYKNLGFNISDFKNSYNFYKNEISLPFHTLLSNEDVQYVSQNLNEILQSN
jgi:dTDP-4-amino-4,6-dideoxygalactose transaminase